jgi:sialic acid synthase SpsE
MEIIAEVGQNHNGDMSLAKDLIWAAKESGADVAKFQLYDANALFSKEGNIWFDYNCKTELSKDQVSFLSEECSRANIEFMASVFDLERIDWLESLGVKRHKIASRSIKDTSLVKALVNTKKDLIVSLGMWSEKEFPKIETSAKIDYLYCISKYPTSLSDLHFSAVDFSKYSGFSDHTVGINASLMAMSRGAGIIEKHLTLDKQMYGPDHQGSMTPNELSLINQFRNDIYMAS